MSTRLADVIFDLPEKTTFGADNPLVFGSHPYTHLPVLSPSGRQPHLRQDEFDDMEPVFAYHAKSFDMTVEADRKDYEAVMTLLANGRCYVKHRSEAWAAGKDAPRIWLEWCEPAMVASPAG